MNITQILSQELSATAVQINAAIELLDDGATVPFIARYRKEATGGLDDTQLRQLAERLQYLRELEDRKAVWTSVIPIFKKPPFQNGYRQKRWSGIDVRPCSLISKA